MSIAALQPVHLLGLQPVSPLAAPVTQAALVSEKIQNGALCRLIGLDSSSIAIASIGTAIPASHVKVCTDRLDRECILVEAWEEELAKIACRSPGARRQAREEKLSREILEDLKPSELQWLQEYDSPVSYERRHYSPVSEEKAKEMAHIAGLWQHHQAIDADVSPREVLETYVMVRIHAVQERYQDLEAFRRQLDFKPTAKGFGPFTITPYLELELQTSSRIKDPVAALTRYLDRRDGQRRITKKKADGDRLTVYFDAHTPDGVGTMIEERQLTIQVRKSS